MSIASILPGRISTSVKGGRRLWREQGITQYSSQLCWLIECLNTCGHLGLKKRTEIDRPSRLYTGTQDTTKVTREYSFTIRLLLKNMCIGTHDEANRVPRS
ncbi:uncharacterized protein EV154DRAFT_556939 [Mucor mucedo]|uniref:uncharacterized protein n=1 Tax=Mucor mucedo TaxID=29922 RepID=UPI00221FB9BE|nr:uncharacterized protein EV154DRAFT_556939 [Mucor mucedo]KAI7867625.1 hypothetical protein EV154DRAFT_556939 [Mucor mucedo]